jgi:GMP synthase-like glutamine amidotransferase
MLPVLIFRHSPTEGPGYFATFLDRHGIPWRLVRIDAGDAVPDNLNGVSGVCLMGGPMSVNDDLPWIPPLLALIREAVASDIPVIGHCLGGQLMARALGGTVGPNPVKEIGWGDVRITDAKAARPWLGDVTAPILAFHWHGETFTPPPGATTILEKPLLRQPGLCAERPPYRHAMPCRNDARTHRQLVRQRRRRDRRQ